MTVRNLYDLNHTAAGGYLARFEYPWEALQGLSDWIKEKQKTLSDEYTELSEGVFVHKTATVYPSALLCAPCIVGKYTEIRQGAYIRGAAVIGENCVIGNSTEIKNAVLFDGVQVPHYNYVGDSILGFRSHMGAGAVASNVKSDKTPVVIRNGDRRFETHLKKCGAMLGDFAEIGCHAVLNPGTVIGRRTSVYPLTCVRGVIPENSIVKHNGAIVKRENSNQER